MREKIRVQADPPDSLVSYCYFAHNFAELSELLFEVE
jgi:hypothetical protein